MNRLIENVNGSKMKMNPIGSTILLLIFSFVFMGLLMAILNIGLIVYYGDPETLVASIGYGGEILLMLSQFIFMILASIVWVKYIERRPKFKVEGSIPKQYALGALGGAVAVAIPSILSIATSNTAPLSADFSGETVKIVLMFLGFFLIQGAAEEVMVRWAIMLPLGKKFGIIPSIVISSGLFSLMHFANPGMEALPIINLFLAGVVFGAMVYYHESMWPAFAAHSLWNFTMGNIFGIEVSGQSFGASILSPELSGNSLFSGGAFGVEGTIFATIVLAIIIGIYYVQYKKKFGSFKNKIEVEEVVEIDENVEEELN